MNNTYTTFEKTLSGLSQGLQVRHIATFDLRTCAPDDRAAEVLDRYADFDQIPVKEGQRVIGVLERNGSQDGLVKDHLRPLDDSILVSADQALLEFVPLMAQAPYYRLVLSGSQVNGVVTRSDLLKLPVRLLGFAMVTNLELLMKDIILKYRPTDAEWLALLSEGRRQKTLEKQQGYKTLRLDPPLIELTEFCDKITLVNKILKLGASFDGEMKGVEKLRNLIAHAATYAASETELQTFTGNLQRARKWIEELGKRLA